MIPASYSFSLELSAPLMEETMFCCFLVLLLLEEESSVFVFFALMGDDVNGCVLDLDWPFDLGNILFTTGFPLTISNGAITRLEEECDLVPYLGVDVIELEATPSFSFG